MLSFESLSVEKKMENLSERANILWPSIIDPEDDLLAVCSSFSGPKYDNLTQVWFSRFARQGYIKDERSEQYIGESSTLDQALNNLNEILSVVEVKNNRRMELERERILANVPFTD